MLRQSHPLSFGHPVISQDLKIVIKTNSVEATCRRTMDRYRIELCTCSSVSIVTRPWAGRPERLWGPPSLLFNGYLELYRG